MEFDRLKPKKILFISLGWEQFPLIEILSKRNDIELYGLHYPGYVYEFKNFKSIFQADYRDLKSITNYIESIKPDAIISDEDDYAMFLQSFYSEKYNLNGPRIHQAQLACNKYLQRSEVANGKFNIPEYSLCRSKSDVDIFIKSHTFPIIIKPIDSRGSIGVSKVNNEEEVRHAFFRALENSHSFLTIAEKFIEGSHYTVDGYCFQNEIGIKALAVSENIKQKDEQGIVNSTIIYGSLNLDLENKLKAEAEGIVSYLGFNFGFFHAEFIKCYSTGKIYLTEIANRGGGILISEKVLPYVTKIPLLDIYISDCLGEKIKISSTFSKCVFARIDFVKLEPGKIYKNINKSDFKKYNTDFFEIISFLKDGTKIPDVTDGSLRHIMILSNIEENRILESLKNTIKIKAQV